MNSMPADHQAERELLGSWMRDQISARDVGSLCVSQRITAAHFDDMRHRAIFSELLSMWQANEPCDEIVISDRLRRTGALEHAGGAAYISEIGSLMSTAANAGAYTEIIRERYAMRRLAIAGMQAKASAMSNGDARDILHETQREIAEITIDPPTENTSLREYMMDAFNNLDAIADGTDTISVGMSHLENAAGPFMRSNVIVICGFAKGGKTTLAVNMAENAAIEGRRVLIFSLEMNGREIAERIMASQGRVDVRSLKRKLMNKAPVNQDEYGRLQRTVGKMRDLDLQIVTNAVSLPQITATARQMHAHKPLDIIVLDYIQLVQGIREKGDSREREVASISRGMKLLASELNCLVIMLSQLNDDGKIRESRAIGQDANLVLAVEGEDGKKSIRVVASRSAPGGTVIPLKWEAAFTRMETIDQRL